MNRESRATWRGYLALILAGAAALSLVGAGILFSRGTRNAPVEILPPATSSLSPTLAPAAAPEVTPHPLRVDVAGAVVAPGVYKLAPDSIVADAIAAAGGPAPDADLDRLNKAVALLDGMQVYVPHLGQPTPQLVAPSGPPPEARSGGAAVAPSVVNINAATQTELEALPGIGPALAQRIIAGRPYSKIEDLLEVKGIGEATFGEIRDQVTVK